ncbi:MAG: YoaK family protein [Chitinophagaceae bacterium]
MLRHVGAKRSFLHNLRLAVLLSLNAGFINAAGFLAFAVLTTNVTGHAALLAVHISDENWQHVRMVALWLLLFLAGAFLSAAYIRRIGADKPHAYTVPILVIIAVLVAVFLLGDTYSGSFAQTGYFAGSLLFAMGMQNALVSIISGSVVRTTHLTGMFTDLGIDLSGLLFSGRADALLRRKIILRLSIISCFLLGGIAGGILFAHFRFRAFAIPVLLLLLALCYDYFRVYFTHALRHKARHHTVLLLLVATRLFLSIFL